MTTSTLPEGYDFTDPDINAQGLPHDEFRVARQNAPITWIEQAKGSYDGMSDESGSGYWALTRHADVSVVSKNSKEWSSAENSAIIRFAEGMQREQIEMQRVIMLNQDAPEHTTTR